MLVSSSGERWVYLQVLQRRQSTPIASRLQQTKSSSLKRPAKEKLPKPPTSFVSKKDRYFVVYFKVQLLQLLVLMAVQSGEKTTWDVQYRFWSLDSSTNKPLDLLQVSERSQLFCRHSRSTPAVSRKHAYPPLRGKQQGMKHCTCKGQHVKPCDQPQVSHWSNLLLTVDLASDATGRWCYQHWHLWTAVAKLQGCSSTV